MPSRARTALAALAVVVALGGCGFGPGEGASGVSLLVTQGFGGRAVGSVSTAHTPGSETVMQMLERSFRIQTRYGGGVQSIDGHAGNGVRTDWFYYVNGVQAAKGAASTAVHRGDQIWWDLHDWRATDSIPAVVGSFPEPFEDGFGGQRYPTTLECGSGVNAACQRVTAALTKYHVPVSPSLIGTGSGPDTLGIVVGIWKQIQYEVASSLIAHGPGASGVYARFAGPNGSSLELLNPDGQVVRTLGAGAGLVAATGTSSAVPTWVITGTDAAGVRAAADAVSESALHDHFALAVQGSQRFEVPLQGGQ